MATRNRKITRTVNGKKVVVGIATEPVPPTPCDFEISFSTSGCLMVTCHKHGTFYKRVRDVREEPRALQPVCIERFKADLISAILIGKTLKR